MKNESRILVSGLSEEHAIALFPNIRKLAPAKSIRMEVIHPEPEIEALYEKEFIKIDDICGRVSIVAERLNEYETYVEKPREVERNIKHLKTELFNLRGLLNRVEAEIFVLEAKLAKDTGKPRITATQIQKGEGNEN